jgi:hypothetical protein
VWQLKSISLVWERHATQEIGLLRLGFLEQLQIAAGIAMLSVCGLNFVEVLAEKIGFAFDMRNDAVDSGAEYSNLGSYSESFLITQGVVFPLMPE